MVSLICKVIMEKSVKVVKVEVLPKHPFSMSLSRGIQLNVFILKSLNKIWEVRERFWILFEIPGRNSSGSLWVSYLSYTEIWKHIHWNFENIFWMIFVNRTSLKSMAESGHNDICFLQTNKSKYLTCEALYITDYEYINISSFAVLGIKLWLEEEWDLHIDQPLYSLKFIQSKVQNCYKVLLSFSYNFYPTQQTWKFFHILNHQ